MTATTSLPAGFESLEPYIDWALPTETLRRQKREASSMAQITDLYRAVLPEAERVFEHFRSAETQAGGADKVDAPTRLLFTLMLAFADASLSVELHKSPIVPDGMPGDIWKPEHETPGWRNKPASVLMPRAA